jgi:BTB/POZ domain-containing adapter for CUL3-mediated RhoA degradation protein
MLAAMFSGSYHAVYDENGAVFIDRDGKHFGKILNYLRSGSVAAASPEECAELQKEAEFFGLTELDQRLHDRGEELPRRRVSKNYVVKSDQERDSIVHNSVKPVVVIECSSSSFGEEKVPLNRITTHVCFCVLTVAGCNHLQAFGFI